MAAVVLDRQSVVPLYYQIQQGLSEQIRSGKLKPGELVPSEQELAARLGVSRMTARQALKSLCSRGLTYSQRGKGTFVSRMKLEKNFRQLLSFSEEMKDRGSQPRSRVLAFKKMAPEGDVAQALHLRPGEEVIFLKRVRMADSAPLCIEATHLPARRCPDLLENFEPSGSVRSAPAESGSTAAPRCACRVRLRSPGSPVHLYRRLDIYNSPLSLSSKYHSRLWVRLVGVGAPAEFRLESSTPANKNGDRDFY